MYQSALSDLYKLGNISYHGNSAMNEKELLIGRPHGGCAIVWSNQLNCKFLPIEINHERLCAVKIYMDNNISLLVVNVYLPCDSYYRDAQYEKTVDILNLISSIIHEQNCDLTMIAGDLNTQFLRNTPHVRAVKSFLDNNHLRSGLEHVLAEVDYTYQSFSNNSKSLIDHICVCDNLFGNINEYITVDSVENMSDHLAVVCGFDRQILSQNLSDRVFQQRAAWHKATLCNIKEYQDTLDELLSTVPLPHNAVTCGNFHCSVRNSHGDDIDKFINNIVQCCINAEAMCIPCTSNKQKGGMPGWNDFVRGQHAEALYWHNLWKDAGRPAEGELASKMRRSRNDYHYSVRFCKRNKDNIAAAKMADALTHGKNRNFWSEIRKGQKTTKSIPCLVDDANSKEAIVNLFHRKFKNLYNTEQIKDDEMASISEELEKRIKCQRNQLQIITVSKVSSLVRKLKRNKRDGSIGLNSNCIIHGTRRLYTMLSIYFNSILVHGHASDVLLLGTLCPLPKTNDLRNSDKYRAIALCSSVAKLFDLIFIDKQKDLMTTDSLQFGFKQKRSTSLCSSILLGIVDKFVAEGSSAYVVLLDMSKAFDRVNFCQLFWTMLQRKMDPIFIRCLMNMYLNQKLRIKWDDHFSNFFSVSNGVKQGGVLSPLLFCIYVDNLLSQLRSSSYGCYIGQHFTGALCYADDIVLISPSLQGLNEMLQVCENFAKTYHLTFNSEKTQFIVFRRKPVEKPLSILFNQTIVREQQSVIHLGHMIYQSRNSDIDRILGSYYKQYNLFRSKFGHVPSVIQSQLHKTYCSSFYGSVLLPLSETIRLQVAWRKSLRQVWRIPYRSHCALLRCLSEGFCDVHMFLARFAKFALCAVQSECETMSCIVRYMTNSKCIFGNNMNKLCQSLGVTYDCLKDKTITEVMRLLRNQCEMQCRSNDNKSLASVLKELSLVRDKMSHCELRHNEITLIINDICLN